MATVNFSVPDDIRDAFNKAFKGQNKSAIITALMREAIDRAERRARHIAAVDRILDRRGQAPILTEEAFRAAREEGRP